MKFIPRVIIFGNKNELSNDLPEFEVVGELEVRDEKYLFLNETQIAPQDLIK